MGRDEMGGLVAFLTVAETGSFTRAAGVLGTSQSALSHTVRRLEERVGIRLLDRTTRSVSPTEAGLDLLQTLQPSIREIQRKLASLSGNRHRIAGTVRITSADHAAETIVWPTVLGLLPLHPELKVEVEVDNGFVDLVAGRYDAGVRLGTNVEKDMVAMTIGNIERKIVVASSSYLGTRSAPQKPADLAKHDCINRTFPTLGGTAAWEFQEKGQTARVRVQGRLTSNRPELIIAAALEGHGLAHVLQSQVNRYLASGHLVEVLQPYASDIPGYQLYYPKRRHANAAFDVVKDALRQAVCG